MQFNYCTLNYSNNILNIFLFCMIRFETPAQNRVLSIGYNCNGITDNAFDC